MKYLLDTMVLLWARGKRENLNDAAQKILSDSKQELYFSAASSWEIAIKYALGRLELPGSPSECLPMWLRSWGLRALEINHVHSLAAGELPTHHQDPFDRMLIAQARVEHLVLVTADPAMDKYEVETLWCKR